MRILLIEDDIDKREKIKAHLSCRGDMSAQFVEAESLHGGLLKLIDKTGYDLVILDMSMPNFDVSPDEPSGGTPESFAGRSVLSQMKLRGIDTQVIVLTQYDSFSDGTVSLKALDEEFKTKFVDFYLGCVYYHAATEAWKTDLDKILNKKLGNLNANIGR